MSADRDSQENRLEVKGINSQGFGTISKLVMRDRNLTPEAKAIYAYICSYAGAGCTAFPSVSLILADLGMSRPRYYKHRKLLEERGYITVFQGERQGSRYAHNTYRINQYCEVSEGARGMQVHEKRGNETIGEEESTGGEDCGKPKEEQVNGGMRFFTVEKSGDLKPLVDEESNSASVQNGASQNVTAITNRFEKSIPDIDTIIHPTNQKEPPSSARGEENAFKRLCDASVQRNLLGSREGLAATKVAYILLLDEGYKPDEVLAAWARRQSMAHREKRKTCHYPQLKKWLESEATDGARAMVDEKREKDQRERRRAYQMAVSELCDRDEDFAAMHAEAQATEQAVAAGTLPRTEAASAWQPIDALIASFLAEKGA